MCRGPLTCRHTHANGNKHAGICTQICRHAHAQGHTDNVPGKYLHVCPCARINTACLNVYGCLSVSVCVRAPGQQGSSAAAKLHANKLAVPRILSLPCRNSRIGSEKTRVLSKPFPLPLQTRRHVFSVLGFWLFSCGSRDTTGVPQNPLSVSAGVGARVNAETFEYGQHVQLSSWHLHRAC